jgi:hypothetical protein
MSFIINLLLYLTIIYIMLEIFISNNFKYKNKLKCELLILNLFIFLFINYFDIINLFKVCFFNKGLICIYNFNNFNNMNK